MDPFRYAEELVDFVRLVRSDKAFGAYAKDVEKLCRLVRPYGRLGSDPVVGSAVDLERLGSFCEYLLVKLSFDERPVVRRMALPEALRILAEAERPDGFRRTLVRDIALAASGVLDEDCSETLRPSAAS